MPFQIVVPVFNEAARLEEILQSAHASGYLGRMYFVDDASTDESPQILRKWMKSHGVRALFLLQNHKKEGAIRQVLETLDARGELLPHTVLLDADSFLVCPKNEPNVVAAVHTAIASMQERDLAALAFRIDVALDDSPGWLERCTFADYSAMQFDQWLLSKQRQVWVINGPGGLFRSDLLLTALRDMTPDFETGDLLITVKLMKQGYGVAYYPQLLVRTYVPKTVASYFKQRRRWERGTTKVLWWERGFYARLFTGGKLLALLTLVHLSLYVGLAGTVYALIGSSEPAYIVGQWFAVTYLTWFAISLAKGLWNKPLQESRGLARYLGYCALNGMLWFGVTTWARVAGFVDALILLVEPTPERVKLKE
jgi:cellulose synthase/poly-beta-1,6-N-acetylglucosamine synthase-like glycosyltransferase